MSNLQKQSAPYIYNRVTVALAILLVIDIDLLQIVHGMDQVIKELTADVTVEEWNPSNIS